MLDNEPTNGADGTAGTTETTDHGAGTPAEGNGGVRVSAPPAGKGARRAAGPPPEPDEIFSPPSTDRVTSIAGSGEGGTVKTSVSTPASGRRTVRAAGSPAEAPAARTSTAGAKKRSDKRESAAEDKTADKPRRESADEAQRSEKAQREPAGKKQRGRKKEQEADRAPAPEETADEDTSEEGSAQPGTLFQPPSTLFQPPVATARATRAAAPPEQPGKDESAEEASGDDTGSADQDHDNDHDGDDAGEERGGRRRRRRGGRGRGRSRTGENEGQDAPSDESAKNEGGKGESDRSADDKKNTSGPDQGSKDDEGDDNGSRRRRRRRRRSGTGGGDGSTNDDPPNTVVKVREPRPEKPIEDEVQAVRGSTRLEAKKQRRREGREQGRRRAPIVTESEFLARREAVKRDLVVRRTGDRTQIAVMEDDVLVEHHVDRASHRSYVGNVYLGRVQNVLPSMEAAFVDIGKGRNAVLYAGEVNWDVLGVEGQPKRIESVLKSGQSVLVQVTKDPVGHKGARLTSQISLPGRYLVYVPGGSMTGISRKLPDKERARLKQILKKVMPADAGVIVRTAAEGASEEELERDITRLAKQWDSIQRKSKSNTAPALLNSEPDLTIRVVRDVFNEDFSSLVVSGEEAWETVHEYVDYVAPNLAERLSHWTEDRDVFSAYRIDEQINKALERKVWLPSGGSLIIDRTEAMTVVDVNTGKFTGQGGNLEETVTKNNLEAAEEIVRQLRLRDVGGIIVIDFIDMVLESNRDLVLRRMLECLSRDRTKHQVAEVTSLGLVQMTRKRVGQGLLEAFSHTCEHCNGRGVLVAEEPVENKGGNGGGRKKKNKGKGDAEASSEKGGKAEDKGGKDKADQGEKADQGSDKPGGKGSKADKGAKAEKVEQQAEDAGSGSEAAEQADEAPSGKKSKGRSRSAKGSGKKAAAAAEESKDEGAGEQGSADGGDEQAAPVEEAPAKRSRKRSTRSKKAAEADRASETEQVTEENTDNGAAPAEAEEAPTKRTRRRTTRSSARSTGDEGADSGEAEGSVSEAPAADGDDEAAERPKRRRTRRTRTAASAGSTADAG
ncbi:Rne/Rng family ribonuclease [Nocardiopsis sp. HNM0947]|uniref:Rne/Rng family ribonuclease n=1 Tax=Nocardiopsis coralli TaxID=2772213 RepID=A0ABR9P3S4_9ACTN|nr:Rne/Rng family ribonuclease [Nocardiopsis coralli]MBE2998496.1 Rne/Rng family ribonuclease [Nocardiopsis coralli]